jgi:hypothetical protein
MNRLQWSVGAMAVTAAALAANAAAAHGFAGSRFFPATIATDDPFVADELSLPTVSTIRNPAEDSSPATQETDVGIDIAKRITPNLGIEIGDTWKHLSPKGQSSVSGFDNLGVALQYQFFLNAPHEAIMSVGLDTDIGGTGTARVGAENFTTLTPQFLFGKGFGDLPDSLRFLKPFAVTGVLGVGFPTEVSTGSGDDVERNPTTLNTGFALEYSIPYLQSQIEDLGIGAPFNRIIPLVEVDLQTPLNRGQSGKTTGTVNPGFVWAGQHYQVGVEAIIPINGRTGHDVGVIAQLHFFLDDLFPHSIGRPLFGG